MKVRVNTAAMGQAFRPCDPEFIRDVCQARCCRSSTDPSGIAVVVQLSEAPALRQRGAVVDEVTGRVAPVDKRCPFQDGDTHLCSLHDDPAYPMGCGVSPLTVNANGTLIVRNRYRMLPCFKAEGAVPVVHAHRASFVALFGERMTDRIAFHVDRGTGAVLHLPVDEALVAALWAKNESSKASA